jgi:hypothetical protein
LIIELLELVSRLTSVLTPEKHALTVEFARVYGRISGCGDVEERQIAEIEKRRDALRACWMEPAEAARGGLVRPAGDTDLLRLQMPLQERSQLLE